MYIIIYIYVTSFNEIIFYVSTAYQLHSGQYLISRALKLKSSGME